MPSEIERAHVQIALSRRLEDTRLDELHAAIDAFRRWRTSLDDLILRQDEDALRALAGLEFRAYIDELRDAQPSFLLIPYLCHPLAASIVSGLLGMPLAVVYERLAPGYTAALDRWGISRIDIARGDRTPSTALREMASVLTQGRHVGLPLDVPHRRGYEVECFGQRFRVAYAYAIVAFREHIPLIPVATWMEHGMLRARKGPPVLRLAGERYRDYLSRTTKILYAFLEESVLQFPAQYRWNEYSLVTAIESYDEQITKWYLHQRIASADKAVQ